LVLMTLTLVSGIAPALAQPAPAAPGTSDAAVKIELNKLEDQPSSCRAYLVVNNTSEKAYEALKLDLVLFQKDGIIGRRFALDLAPLRAKKLSVKLFDLDSLKCADLGSFLINDVLDCKVGGTEETGCLDRLAVSSRTKIDLTK